VRWATRGGVHVDRAGCAWLIRRFIDPDAGFSFVDDSADVAQDAIPFDMPGVELAHHGPDCTFETMLKRYQLHDPVLSAIAEVVHEADLEDDRFDARPPRAWTSSSAGSPSPSTTRPSST